MRVLVVEDDEDFRQSLEELLLKRGHIVDIAETGFAALKQLDGVDILLADIGIGGLNGLDLCTEAQRRQPHLAVIIMTGQDSTWARDESSRRGASAFLAKPFEKEELLGHLQKLESNLLSTKLQPPGQSAVGTFGI